MGHHWIPVVHLRSFSADSELGRKAHIVAYDVAKNRFLPEETTVSKVVQRKRLYDPSREQAKAPLEARAVSILQRMSASPGALAITEDERDHVALYVAMLTEQNPAYQEWVLDMAKRYIELAPPNLDPRIQIESSKEDVEREAFAGVPKMATLLCEKTWHVWIRCEPPYFLIGDDPIVFAQSQDPKLRPSPGGIVSMALPISPTAVLVTLNHPPDHESVSEARENRVHTINLAIYEQTNRLIFGRKRTDFAGLLEYLSLSKRLGKPGDRKGPFRPSLEDLRPGFNQMIAEAEAELAKRDARKIS